MTLKASMKSHPDQETLNTKCSIVYKKTSTRAEQECEAAPNDVVCFISLKCVLLLTISLECQELERCWLPIMQQPSPVVRMQEVRFGNYFSFVPGSVEARYGAVSNDVASVIV